MSRISLPAGRSADIIRSGGERSATLLRPLLLLLIPSSLLLSLACGNGGDPDSATGAEELPEDAQAVRSVDFEQIGAVQDLMSQLGDGAVERGAVLYADLTGDRREEAIVPLTSQGTLGNIGYLVFSLASGQPEVILTRTVDRSSAGGLHMSLVDGALRETRGVYGPDDPFCCPSQLRETTFRWDGALLQVANEVLVQQDPGPKR